MEQNSLHQPLAAEIASEGGIWPPPPSEQPKVACPFRSLFRRAPGKIGGKAHISDLREGFLEFAPEGLIIQGKAVPRAEIRTAVMVPLVLLSLLLAAVAGTIMEYALRHDERFGVRWADVREICLSPARHEACVVYEAPNYKGVVKTFSLALRLGPDYFPYFQQAAQQFAPTQFREGRLRNATSLIVWIFLGALVAALVGGLLWAVLASPHH